MILIDYQDKRPLYEQLTEKFKELIVIGALEPDTKIPSVRNLAIDLSINPNTIQRAYLELERMGFIYTVKGRGNYVAKESFWKSSEKELLLTDLSRLLLKMKAMDISKRELAKKIDEIYGEESL